jgi:hypothetical protein
MFCHFVGLKATKTHAEYIPCTITSMDFFDRLYEKGTVLTCIPTTDNSTQHQQPLFHPYNNNDNDNNIEFI